MKISLVIPALDEADHIAEAIESATAACQGAELEICVVDGGSRDATILRARAADSHGHPLRVLERRSAGRAWPDGPEGPEGPEAPRRSAGPALPGLGGAQPEPGPGPGGGRSGQLQAGAEATEGEVLVFLHADTRLPQGWDRAMLGSLERSELVGGAFGFRFSRRPGEWPEEPLRALSLRLVEAGARLRSRLLGLPYGDQALFVRRSVLEELGGVPQVALMEDLDLVKAMRRQGRLALLGLDVETSARRHLRAGIWATACRHALAAVAWGLGLDRRRIAAWVGR